MGIYKRVLKLTMIVFALLSLAACSSSGYDVQKFPIGEKGSPLKKVIVNNKEYELKNIYSDEPQSLDIQVELKETDSSYINIILPKLIPGYSWHIDEKFYWAVKEYKIEEIQNDKSKNYEGASNELQIFTIDTSRIEGFSINFRWININENEKTFNERKVSYTVNIKW